MKAMYGLATCVLLLAGCNSGGSSTPTVPGLGNTNGFLRFVNGSADAGAVDIYVDGNLSSSDTNVPYGKITAYQQFSSGTHTIKVTQTGTQTVVGSLSNASVSINNQNYASIVLAGENHATAASNPIQLVTINDQLFNTGSGGAAVNFHNAATGLNATEQFGYYGLTSGPNGTLGSPVGVGSETNPQGIPSGVAGSTAIGLYAGSMTGITISPSAVDSSGCSSNVMPCNSGNLSLYLIDGPAASSSPSAGPYPQGITATETAAFVGIFDANGT